MAEQIQHECKHEDRWESHERRLTTVEITQKEQGETMHKIEIAQEVAAVETRRTNEILGRMETFFSEEFFKKEVGFYISEQEKLMIKMQDNKQPESKFNPTASLIRIVEFLIAIILILLGGEAAGVFHFLK